MSDHEWWSVGLIQHNADGTYVQQSWRVDAAYAASMREHMAPPDLTQLFTPDEVRELAAAGEDTLYAMGDTEAAS